MSERVELSHLTPAKRKTALAIIASRDDIIESGGRLTAPAILERIPRFHVQGKAIQRRQLYDDDYIELWRVPNTRSDPDDQLKRLTAERNRLRKKAAGHRERISELEKKLAEAKQEIAQRIEAAKDLDAKLQTVLAGYVEDLP